MPADFQQRTRGHEIRVQTSTPALCGEWDASRLERALDNLLTNAIKHSHDGGTITLAVGAEEAARSFAVLADRDQGIGIPAADLPGIFTPSYRAANVVGRILGTGLGLAGARQIVEQHGGIVAVESQEGVGTCFTMRLPLAPAGEEPAE